MAHSIGQRPAAGFRSGGAFGGRPAAGVRGGSFFSGRSVSRGGGWLGGRPPAGTAYRRGRGWGHSFSYRPGVRWSFWNLFRPSPVVVVSGTPRVVRTDAEDCVVAAVIVSAIALAFFLSMLRYY